MRLVGVATVFDVRSPLLSLDTQITVQNIQNVRQPEIPNTHLHLDSGFSGVGPKVLLPSHHLSLLNTKVFSGKLVSAMALNHIHSYIGQKSCS